MSGSSLKRVQSEQLYQEALKCFPGGVNSPVRAFKSVHGAPLFIDRGDGHQIWDADGNNYIDFCCSWGPLILGHNSTEVREAVTCALQRGTSFGAPTRKESELAQLILDNNPVIDKIRFVNSGTEAVMSAIRLARGATGRSKVLKFEGCYHGHVDSLMVQAGSGLVTLGTSSSAGIPEPFVHETVVVPLNNKEALQAAVEKYKEDLACIIIEPIPANNGLLLQEEDFLYFVRDLCTKHGILLLFDEVISGFRVHFSGAAGLYGIKPDLVTYGKIIGGGFPVGAYGASAELMQHVSPEGPVYQAGTLSGNPIAMTAGIAQLKECLEDGFYEMLAERTNRFVDTVQSHAIQHGYTFRMHAIGSIFWMAFSDDEHIRAANEIKTDGMGTFRELHLALLERGVYVGPSGYEVGFISRAHTDEVLDQAAKAFTDSLDQVFGA